MLILVGALGGCTEKNAGTSSEKTKSSETGPTEVVMPKTDELPAKDLGGYEFIIADGSLYGEGDPNRMQDQAGVSDLNDAFLARNRKIEQKYNCKITYKYYDPLTFFNDVSLSLMAGDKVADVLIPCEWAYGHFVNAQLLKNLRDLPYVNMDKPYWVKSLEEMAKVGGKSYGGSNQMARAEGHAVSCYFNKNLIKKLGLENPYDLVKQDKWNWDTFKVMLDAAQKDNDNNSTWDDKDSWGATGSTYQAAEAFYVTSGQKIIDYTSASKKIPQYTLKDSASLDALTKLKDMFKAPGAYYNPNCDYGLQTKLFMDGKCLFYIDNLYHYDTLREMSDDYGVVPMPKGPGQKDYYSLVSHNAGIICVPKTITDEEKTGMILQSLSFEAYAEREIFINQVSNMFWRDEESADMARSFIIPSMTGDISYLWHTVTPEIAEGTNQAVSFPMLVDKTLEFSTYIAQYGDLIQNYLNDTYGKQ